MIDLKKLAEPFPPDVISWRAGPVSNGKTKALAYIDARDVQDRLDAVCGPENWQVRFPWSDGKALCCEIGIMVTRDTPGGQVGDWIWKGDGAGESDIEAEKGRFSDAFKRAAVRWGIGRYLYNVDGPWVALNGKQIAESEMPRLRAVLTGQRPPPPAQPHGKPPGPGLPGSRKIILGTGAGPAAWADQMVKEIKAAKHQDEMKALARDNADALTALILKSPASAARIREAEAQRWDELNPVGAG